jgi:hypothetical protein
MLRNALAKGIPAGAARAEKVDLWISRQQRGTAQTKLDPDSR